ncbi:hypothetical protein V8E54_001983 [Elaphomyces granulatus]
MVLTNACTLLGQVNGAAGTVAGIVPDPNGSPQAAEERSETQTRIDIYFFEGSLGHASFAELLRLVVHDLETINHIGTPDPVNFYTQAIAHTMWNYGGAVANREIIRYDCSRFNGGRPRYGVTFSGGTFKLSSFLKRTDQECNCYDLAAIIQVCCQAMGNKPNPASGNDQPSEILQSY